MSPLYGHLEFSALKVEGSDAYKEAFMEVKSIIYHMGWIIQGSPCICTSEDLWEGQGEEQITH